MTNVFNSLNSLIWLLVLILVIAVVVVVVRAVLTARAAPRPPESATPPSVTTRPPRRSPATTSLVPPAGCPSNPRTRVPTWPKVPESLQNPSRGAYPDRDCGGPILYLRRCLFDDPWG